MSTGIVFVPPTLSIVFSCNILKNFDWSEIGTSPTSSKNKVPPIANSHLPIFPPLFAPVNAPSSYPNNSLSNKGSGMAAQFIAINGPFPLLLELCIALANNSFPVPLSPLIRTVESLFVIFLAACLIFSISDDSPTISSNTTL